MKRSFLFFFLIFTTLVFSAEEKIKSGYNLGALPAVSYNSDLGFQYGAILNLFNYGNGSRYPAYDHSAYLEISRYIKGSGVFRFYYDSEKLISGIRSFIELSYLTDDLMDFYGFNGYKSNYYADLVESNRVFYKMSQKQTRLLADFKGCLPVNNLFWIVSYNFENYKIGTVDFEKLNKVVYSSDPDYLTGENLYSNYINIGLIGRKEAKGGTLNAFKAGLVYDRPVLNNPKKGSYTEALIDYAPIFMNELPYARYSLIHCQYKNIIKDKLNAAIRLYTQGQIGSQIVPFFRRTQLMSPFSKRTNVTGLGGSNSLRGVLRNKVVGDAVAFGNIELRWKVVNFRFFNQNFYFGINGFFDTGIILDPVNWDKDKLTGENTFAYVNFYAKDGFHSSTGGGIKVAMNKNFVIPAEVGKALDERDGEALNAYINLNYLF
jgi:hypothetical protein